MIPREIGPGAYVDGLTAEVAASTCRNRSVPAALLFADVSGYTALTERLATLGRVGSEMLTDIITGCFERLIDDVIVGDGHVVRFGGDALLIAFTGSDRLDRAVSTARAMQRTIGELHTIQAPGGRVRLSQSIGLHHGELALHRWSGSWTEVVPYGPAVTEVLRCEVAAHAGQVALSDAVVAELAPRCVRQRDDGVVVLRNTMSGVDTSRTSGLRRDSAMWHVRRAMGTSVLSPSIRDAVNAGVEPAHRPAAIGFVAVSGLDVLAGGPSGMCEVADSLFAAVDEASRALGVALISTDVAPDGIKLIIAAGIPTTVGEDGERLVLALERIMAATDGVTIRAGASLGVVFAADVGHARRRTYTVMGDTVNLSARLAYQARPGQVLASAALVETLPERFRFGWVPAFNVKGKRAPQMAAVVSSSGSLVDTGAAADAVGVAAAPFRGRRSEVGRLRQAVRTSPVHDVFGPAGFGSSRLVTEALAGFDQQRQVTTVRVGVIDRSSPLLVMRRLVEALGNEQIWAAISTSAFGRRTKHSGASSIAGGVEAMARIAGDILELWPAEHIVVIDGSHLLDEASGSVVKALAATLQANPRGRRLVITGREPSYGINAVQIELAPLAARDVRQIVLDASDLPLSDADLEVIVAAAGGSPLFARELARLGPRSELPPTLEALVASRIDRLSTPVARMVRTLALIGPRCNVADAAAVVETTGQEIRAVVDRSEGALVLDGENLRFSDDALRLVAASGLAVARRRVVHARVARRLEQTEAPAAAIVADHWFEAGDDPATVRWADRAGQAAFGAGASAEASHYFERALLAAQRLQLSNVDVGHLAERLATAAQAARRSDLEGWALQRAVVVAPSSGAAVRLMVRQATCARTSGRLRAAAAHLGRARRFASLDDPVIQCELLVEQAWIAVWSDRWDRALDLATCARAAAMEAEEPALQFHAWSLIEQVSSAKALPGAGEAGDEALRAARASGDERLVGLAEGNLAVIADNRGRWKQAVNGYTRAERAFRRCGDVVNVAASQLNQASILIELGDVETASALAVDAARVFAAAGEAEWATSATGLSLRAMVREGRGDGTHVAVLEACVTALAAGGDDERTAFQEVGLVEVLLLTGNVEAATERCLHLIDIVDRFGDGHLLPVTVRRLLGIAADTVGDRPAADRWFHDARTRAERHEIAPELAALASIDARRAIHDGAPDRTLRSEVSAGLDAALGVLSRPLFRRSVAPPS